MAERVKKFLTMEVVLSLIVPLIVSLSSFAVMHGQNTERMNVVEKRIEILNTDGTKRLQDHLIIDAATNEQLIAEIKVLNTKLDQIRQDLQELKAKK
jgi:hypothetical protein